MFPETIAIWRTLEGRAIDNRLQLDRLESHERVPVFAGTLDGKPVHVRFFPEAEGSTAIYDRHREAMFLSHTHLVPCLGTGHLALEGDQYVYGVYEAPNLLLSVATTGKTLTPAEVRGICRDVLNGLEYLHGIGLVYCNLDRVTIARSGTVWKLCDYSELRPEGSGYSTDTRRLLASLPGAPPEAYSGVVGPAWDAWSIGQLVRALAPSARSHDPKRPRQPQLPESFQALVAGCLVPDPGARWTVGEIKQYLDAPPSKQPATAAADDAGHEEAHVFSAAAPSKPRRMTAAILAGTALALALLYSVSGYFREHQTNTAASEKAAATASETARPAASEERSRSAPVDPKAQVEQVVTNWADAFRRGDVDTETSFYAPTVRRFFRSANVTRDYVRRTKATAQRDAGRIVTYDLSDIQTVLSGPDAATVTFEKTWDFVGKQRNTGQVKGELQLQRMDGAWRIVSERDLLVHRQWRGRV